MTAGRKPYPNTEAQRKVQHKIKLWLRGHKDGGCMTYTQVARRLNQKRVCSNCGVGYYPDQQLKRCVKCGGCAFKKKNVPAPGGGLWTYQSVKVVAERKTVSKPVRLKQIEKRSLHANDYLNKQQLGMALRACPVRDRLIFETLLCTGMRPKIEFCYLQIRDLGVWHGQHQIDVRKGKRRTARGITIDRELAEMLRKHRLHDRRGAGRKDPVFVNNRGDALSYQVLWEKLKAIGLKSGVGRLNPYRLRHTFGTVLYKDKKDLDYVAKQMGHKNIQTTRLYVHTTETEESEQMEGFRRHVKEAENLRKYPISKDEDISTDKEGD